MSKRRGLVLALMILLLWLFWRSPVPQTPVPPQGNTPSEKAFRERVGKVIVLPFDGIPVIPYQRPTSPMPVMLDVFEDVEFTMDGQRIAPGSELRFKVGQRIQVIIDVIHNDQIPQDIWMSGGGIGLLCCADNPEGWMVIDSQFLNAQSVHRNSATGVQIVAHTENVWIVPELRGTFNLGILGQAERISAPITPVRLLRSYPAVIE